MMTDAQLHQLALDYADTAAELRTVAAENRARHGADAAKHAEDERANRRNRNRTLVLCVSILMGFLAPTLCARLHIPLAYSFLCIIVPDAFLQLYSLIRKY